MRFHVRKHMVVIGFNNEPTLRFGVRKVDPHLARGGFTAIGAWPLLIGIGKVPRVKRRNRKLLKQINRQVGELTPQQRAAWQKLLDEDDEEEVA